MRATYAVAEGFASLEYPGLSPKRFEPATIFLNEINSYGGPEGRGFLQEINTLAAGSPTHFPRILSYGLAKLKIKKGTSFPCKRGLYLIHTKGR